METRWVVILCLYLLLADFRGTFGQDVCSAESIQGFSVAQRSVGMVTLSWKVASFTNASYVLDYSSLSSSETKEKTVSRDSNLSNGNVTLKLVGLLNFTTYNMSVHTMCYDGMNQLVRGPPSSMLVETIAAIPSGIVKNVSFVNVSSSGSLYLLNISWDPLEEQLWNGIPRTYTVYITQPDKMRVPHTVHVPYSSLLISLHAGLYGVEVEAVNEKGPAGITTELLSIDLTATSGLSVADYPYFYIIIPGVVFLAVILAIPIFIFRKLHENKMRSISYVRDIEDKMNLGGFGNMIPMRELSPQSPYTPSSIPVSSSTNSSFPTTLHPHLQLANRPLPLSPMTPTTPAEDSANFNAAAPTSTHVLTSSNSNSSLGAMSYKKSIGTHPGPLPKLEENVEHSGGFLPISRTMTNQSFGSVFSPNSVASAPLSPPMPQQQQHPSQASHQQRGRSNTLGGPSPYEVPDTNNGSTLHDTRPSSAHSNLQLRTAAGTGCDVGTSFPPPPTHSPPGLTHSSGDIHMRVMNEHPHHHHVGGATGGTGYHHTHPHQHNTSNADNSKNPRKMPNQRSFSSSSSHGHIVNDPRLLSSMRSDGHIPTSPEDDRMSYTQSSNGAENTVYIHPPLDSDLELQSTSSCGGLPHESEAIAQRQGPEQGQPLHLHQPNRHGHQLQYPGMNGSVASPEPFNNFEGDGPHKQALHYPAPPLREQERGRDPSRRESLYSETSTELSITSDSDKETSPCGWDREHKVSRSDVGMSRQPHNYHHRHHRHHRSSTPPERETFSDVGGLGNGVRFQQNGFV